MFGTVKAVGSDVKHSKKGESHRFHRGDSLDYIDEGVSPQYTILREDCAANISQNPS